jgi:hypothetical protein
MQLAAPRPLIERLNVFQPMFKPITAQIDFVLCDRVEHERIVRIGRMTQRKNVGALLAHSFKLFLIILFAHREAGMARPSVLLVAAVRFDVAR